MENILINLTLFFTFISSCIGSNIKYLDTAIQNIALNKKNIYIGAVNSIWKLDYNLNHKINRTTGPKLDDPIHCVPDENDVVYCFDREKRKVNNFNQILLIIGNENKPDHSLLSCGTLYQGTCTYLLLDNLKEAKISEDVQKELLHNYVSANLPNATTVAVSSPDGRILYVARTMTYGIDLIQGKMYHTIAARSLQNTSTNLFPDLTILNNRMEKIKYSPGLFYNINGTADFKIASYPIYYTNAFLANNYVYFTTIQQKNILGTPMLSKLIRISPDAADGYRLLEKYYEQVISCNHKDIVYNLLISVSIIKITKLYADLPEFKIGDHIIFGIFVQSEGYKIYPDSYKDFAICYFSLNAVNRQLDETMKSCTAPKAPWIQSYGCNIKVPIKDLPLSYAPSGAINGTLIHTEKRVMYQAVYAYGHARGISLFLSSNGHSLLKFAVIRENGTTRLYRYSKVVFTPDGKGSSMFFNMVLDPTKKWIFLTSKHHVARVPVVDCGSRRSCIDCIRGPSCGWCSLIRRCNMKSHCPNNEKAKYYVKSSQECPSSKIENPMFAVEMPKQITLQTRNVPADATYSCRIGSVYVSLTRDASKFTCKVFNFSSVTSFDNKTGEGNVSVSLVSKVSGKYYAVVTSTITLYRCASNNICDKCITGKFNCGWCSKEMTCSHKRRSCADWISYKGYGSDESLRLCPRLLNTPNRFLPSGEERAVVLNGRLFPKPSKSSYECILKIADNKFRTRAVWINSTQLACQKKQYQYSAQKDFLVGNFIVSYGDATIDSSKVRATVYKCGMKKVCSTCLNATAEWKCGWCGKPQRCRLKSSCLKDDPALTRCPNPVIKEFIPEKASINAETLVTIKGSDLGSSGGVKSITISGVKCIPIREKHIESTRIVCKLQKMEKEASGIILLALTTYEQDVYGQSKKKFYFVKPKVQDFLPRVGPCSGGTILTITGENLDVGNSCKVFVGIDGCNVKKRNSTHIVCKTSASQCQDTSRRRRSTSSTPRVRVNFDGNNVYSPGNIQFSYKMDPIINSVYTNKENIISKFKTFFSGGQAVNVEGLRLNLIQDPKLIFTTFGRISKTFKSSCTFNDGSDQRPPGTYMKCLAPNISSAFPYIGKENKTVVRLGFEMADVTNMRHYRNVTVVSDPFFFSFPGGLRQINSSVLILSGSGLSVLNRRDVSVWIAGVPCNNVGVEERLMCTIKQDLQDDNGIYDVKVTIGEGGLVYNVGNIKFFVPKSGDYTLYFIMAAAGVVILIIVIITVCVLYRRKHLREKKDHHKDLQLHMDKMESQYARECKEAFAEYQIEKSDLTHEVDQETAPCREFRQFAMRVLYPGLDSHPILEENKDDRTEWERCMKSFILLLKDKEFILTFVRTLEGQSTFQMTDRCIVASLLMVSLQDDISFVTDILKELLTDLINKAGSGKRPKLLLRRTESIAEKLLTNWLAYTLFDFLNDVVGESLFKMFTAINILLDKEPADAITFDAKNSLSEDKLLRTKIDFKVILLNVEYIHPKDGRVYEGIPVLSADTITQAKEKILKHIYKNQPHSVRPLPDEVQLGHVGSSGAIRYMQDCDASNVVEGQWKKLNTLGYVLNLHKIPECSCLRLSFCANAPSINGSAMMDDSLPNVTFHSIVSSTPMLHDYGGNNSIEPKLWHLVKPADSDYTQKDDIRHSKMMAEVYLTRLLKTKETLLRFVNQLFECIFGKCEVGRVIPPSIKFLFDFLDNEAEKQCIEDSEVHHTWKNNSLPLRFWINIIKNPDFVFDIRKSNTVDSCLSVIAQLFMDSCSPDEHRLGMDSPSNKLLYAKEIPTYKKEVKRFYKEVKDSRFDEKEFYNKLDEISSMYGDSFNSFNAAHELMFYAVKYKVKLMDNLEDNSYVVHAEKLQEIMENIPDD